VGEYLLLATLNRALAPPANANSRLYRNNHLGPAASAAPGRFAQSALLDHLHALDAAKLARIEEDLTRRLVEEWGVGLKRCFTNTTNFDTFLSSENPAKLAQRGHAKSKRTRSTHRGLGPAGFLGFSYSSLLPGLRGQPERLGHLQRGSGRSGRSLPDVPQKCENITLVFDKGNNSAENFQELDNSP